MKFCSVWRKKRNYWHRNAHNFVQTIVETVAATEVSPIHAPKPLVNQLMMFATTNSWMNYWDRCRWRESGHRRMTKQHHRRRRRPQRPQPPILVVWSVRCDWNGIGGKVYRIPYKMSASFVANRMRQQLAAEPHGGMWRYLSKLKMGPFSYSLPHNKINTSIVDSWAFVCMLQTRSIFFSPNDM